MASFDDLIERVLQSIDKQGSNKGGGNSSWDDSPSGQKYWEDIRKRRTDLEVGKQTGQNALNLEQEKEKGSLARENIAAGSSKYKADTEAGAHRYASDKTFEAAHDKVTGTPEEQKNKYLENNTLPDIKRKFNAKQIKQINPITNEVIEIHNSLTDIRSKFQIGSMKIKQIIEDEEVYKGYKWSY